MFIELKKIYGNKVVKVFICTSDMRRNREVYYNKYAEIYMFMSKELNWIVSSAENYQKDGLLSYVYNNKNKAFPPETGWYINGYENPGSFTMDEHHE